MSEEMLAFWSTLDWPILFRSDRYSAVLEVVSYMCGHKRRTESFLNILMIFRDLFNNNNNNSSIIAKVVIKNY